MRVNRVQGRPIAGASRAIRKLSLRSDTLIHRHVSHCLLMLPQWQRQSTSVHQFPRLLTRSRSRRFANPSVPELTPKTRIVISS
ncbi:uncharacterized protein N7496_000957 [Penicillium cataractarum]|uniref:Uncharacterized protein n=1 Tax=Penicillium cataractarum TaxID=2100454 RepID=A0A9W9VVE9_9EURO|nr:uncharacterized protein N7496_000957 [Penicillium cataractarum]KAJ5389889.1 hypothetical protein N7496_000957 [Penicillium cataractarum]